jgi:predicted PurR-regulated permease PerM
VLGIQGAVLWGVMMGLLSFLPMFGSALVWAPAAIWLALSGSLTKGIILAAVGLGIMGQVDNVLRPLLLSGKARLSTLVLVISLLGGVSAFGFIGIVLGPLVAALVTAIFESYEAMLPGSNSGSAPGAGPGTALAPSAEDPVAGVRPQADTKP